MTKKIKYNNEYLRWELLDSDVVVAFAEGSASENPWDVNGGVWPYADGSGRVCQLTPGGTVDATATSADILEGQTAYARGNRLIGTISTVTPRVEDNAVIVPKGYVAREQIITVEGTGPADYGYVTEEGSFQPIALDGDVPQNVGEAVELEEGSVFLYATGHSEPDYSINTTASADNVVDGKTVVLNGMLTTGTMPASTPTVSGNIVSIPKGYITEDTSFTVGTSGSGLEFYECASYTPASESGEYQSIVISNVTSSDSQAVSELEGTYVLESGTLDNKNMVFSKNDGMSIKQSAEGWNIYDSTESVYMDISSLFHPFYLPNDGSYEANKISNGTEVSFTLTNATVKLPATSESWSGYKMAWNEGQPGDGILVTEAHFEVDGEPMTGYVYNGEYLPDSNSYGDGFARATGILSDKLWIQYVEGSHNKWLIWEPHEWGENIYYSNTTSGKDASISEVCAGPWEPEVNGHSWIPVLNPMGSPAGWAKTEELVEGLEIKGYIPEVGKVYAFDSTINGNMYPAEITSEGGVELPEGITVSPTDVLDGVFYIDSTGNKVEGTMPTVHHSVEQNVVTIGSGYIEGVEFTVGRSLGATEYTPGTTDQQIEPDTYLTGVQTIKGDSSLVGSNIKKGITIFGVDGTLESGIDTSDATALDYTILAGFTAYGNGAKIVGTMPDRSHADFDVTDQSYNGYWWEALCEYHWTMPGGYYGGNEGYVTIQNLEPSVIKAGTTIKIGTSEIIGEYEGESFDFSAASFDFSNYLPTGWSAYNCYGDLEHGQAQILPDRVTTFNTLTDLNGDNKNILWLSSSPGYVSSDGYVEINGLSEVKPENIKKDVVIAGVTGTYEGESTGGSGSTMEFYECASVNSGESYTGNIVVSGIGDPDGVYTPINSLPFTDNAWTMTNDLSTFYMTLWDDCWILWEGYNDDPMIYASSNNTNPSATAQELCSSTWTEGTFTAEVDSSGPSGTPTWSGYKMAWSEGESGWVKTDELVEGLEIKGYTPEVGKVYAFDSTINGNMYPAEIPSGGGDSAGGSSSGVAHTDNITAPSDDNSKVILLLGSPSAPVASAKALHVYNWGGPSYEQCWRNGTKIVAPTDYDFDGVEDGVFMVDEDDGSGFNGHGSVKPWECTWEDDEYDDIICIAWSVK